MEGKVMSEGKTIRAKIEKLRAMWWAAFKARHGKTDFYGYLAEVLKLYFEWRQSEARKKNKRLLAATYELKIRKNTHTIRAIIDASSEDEDPRVKSKWTRALQYAANNGNKVKERGLVEFLEENGGVEGCAAKGTKQRNQKKAADRRAA
jgi:hypothetical protein